MTFLLLRFISETCLFLLLSAMVLNLENHVTQPASLILLEEKNKIYMISFSCNRNMTTELNPSYFLFVYLNF